MTANLTQEAKQGELYTLNFDYSVDGASVDLTGWSAVMQVRTSPGATPVIDLTVGAGITLAGGTYNVAIEVLSTVMAAVPTGQYVYVIGLTSSIGRTIIPLEGTFSVTPGIPA